MFKYMQIEKCLLKNNLCRIFSTYSEKMSDHERIAQVAHQKWANERVVNFLCESLICSFFRKNERFAQKTDEWISNPAYCIRQKKYSAIADAVTIFKLPTVQLS